MKFVRYNDLTNTYRQEFIDKILFEEKDKGEWLVTEKIHGANFSLWVDKDQVRMAKRSGFISAEDNFFGAQQMKEDLFGKARFLYDCIEVEELAIFGELYGGEYPHPDVLRDSTAQKVQSKVWYSPNNEFIVYDIKIDGIFQSYEMVKRYCLHTGFPFVYSLFNGTFRECLEYNNEFPSTIYKRFNLPEIVDNICEGIVIRPNEARFVYDRSRVMLKSKNARFAEKDRKKKVKVKVELSEGIKAVVEEMSTMVTDNRYDAVVSKIGKVSPKDFGMLQGLMTKDILEELGGDSKLYFTYNSLEKAERKTINKMIGFEVAKVVRRRLIEQ